MQKGLTRAGKIFFLVMLIILNSGCLSSPAVLPAQSSSLDKILPALSGAVAENDRVISLAQIELVTEKGTYPSRAALIMKKPSYLRLELLPVFGNPDFFLVSSPRQMSIYIPSKREFYQGKPTATNLARFLPWQFNLPDIVAIMTGGLPPMASGNLTKEAYPDGNFIRIEIKADSGGMQKIWVDEKKRLLKLMLYDEAGQAIYHVQYEDYQEEKPVAGQITITMADGRTIFSVKFIDWQIEKNVTDLSVFNLPVPAGVNPVLLD